LYSGSVRRFRASDLSNAGSLLAGMAGWHGLETASLNRHAFIEIVWLAGLYAIVWAAPTTRQIMQGEPASRLAWRPI